ncbi:MAG TPA: polysaccharide deacetylase family protein [Polyangia bacterium]|nr:polysaccharide deacetylase family protein [Polyangia bacterium]
MPSAVLLPFLLALRGTAALPARPISHVETHEPAVAITFDACATMKGQYGFDEEVFAILKREQVPATIFVSGRWVDTHAQAMAELTGDPLIEFGDHSYDHPHMTKLTVARMGEEIDKTEAALSRYGRHSVAFRPPFGDWNRRVIDVLRERKLPTVTWDVVSGDPSAKATTDGMIHVVLGQARPGSIIIFHINGRGWKTHEALPAILTGLRERGFRFVPLSELMRQQDASAAAPAAPAGDSAPPPPAGAVP